VEEENPSENQLTQVHLEKWPLVVVVVVAVAVAVVVVVAAAAAAAVLSRTLSVNVTQSNCCQLQKLYLSILCTCYFGYVVNYINGSSSFLAKEPTGCCILIAGLEPVGTRSKQNCHCRQFTGVVYVSPTKCSEFSHFIYLSVYECCLSYVHIRSNWVVFAR